MEPRVLTIVGARPQFVKAVAVSRALAAVGIRETIVHTGQHYDESMSKVFFDELQIPVPAYNLGIGSGGHSSQTGRMLESLEAVMVGEKPAMALVYGDTNSTLAGALCAAKLRIPVAHVEAGLRSFNRRMPEEVNRVVTDHLSDLLFAPTLSAMENLEAEGIRAGVVRSGDVMYDAFLLFKDPVGACAVEMLNKFSLRSREFAVVTVHRAENTDEPARWTAIIDGIRAVARSGMPVVWPAHPRVIERVLPLREEGVQCVPALPYFETQGLLMNARVLLTDSGGLQKEAAFHGTPCVTLRDETEWMELVTNGVNSLAGADATRIRDMAWAAKWPKRGLPEGIYGDGKSAEGIAGSIREFVAQRG